jgi:hypothetical protein
MERFLILWLAIGILLLPACGKPVYPLTNGSYQTRPEAPARLVIWGPNQPAVAAVGTWLQKRGFLILAPEKIRHIMNERLIGEGQGRLEEVAILQAAKSLGADGVVFVDAARTTLPQENFAHHGNDSVDLYSISLSLRGLDTKTGEVMWDGSAFFPPTDVLIDEPLEKLACHALATVWGFRPAGHHPIPSEDVCDVPDNSRYAPSAKGYR